VCAEKAAHIEAISGATFAESALAAVDGVEALVVATEWGEFSNVDLALVKERMTTPIIFDGRNVFDPRTMAELGFHYHSIGRKAVKPH
jgi:UDPglucose 6-dehydrogenase